VNLNINKVDRKEILRLGSLSQDVFINRWQVSHYLDWQPLNLLAIGFPISGQDQTGLATSSNPGLNISDFVTNGSTLNLTDSSKKPIVAQGSVYAAEKKIQPGI